MTELARSDRSTRVDLGRVRGAGREAQGRSSPVARPRRCRGLHRAGGRTGNPGRDPSRPDQRPRRRRASAGSEARRTDSYDSYYRHRAAPAVGSAAGRRRRDAGVSWWSSSIALVSGVVGSGRCRSHRVFHLQPAFDSASSFAGVRSSPGCCSRTRSTGRRRRPSRAARSSASGGRQPSSTPDATSRTQCAPTYSANSASRSTYFPLPTPLVDEDDVSDPEGSTARRAGRFG